MWLTHVGVVNVVQGPYSLKFLSKFLSKNLVIISLCSVHDVVFKHLSKSTTTFKQVFEQRMGKDEPNSSLVFVEAGCPVPLHLFNMTEPVEFFLCAETSSALLLRKICVCNSSLKRLRPTINFKSLYFTLGH